MAIFGKIVYDNGCDTIIRNRGRVPCGRVMGVHNEANYFRPVERGVVAFAHGIFKRNPMTRKERKNDNVLR